MCDHIQMRVVAAVIQDQDKVLVCRRAPHKSLAGKWEFPGGKVEAGESDPQALIREIHEELGSEISVGTFIVKSTLETSESSLEMHTYFAKLVSAPPTASSDHDELRWVQIDELPSLEWPVLDIPVVDALTRKP